MTVHVELGGVGDRVGGQELHFSRGDADDLEDVEHERLADGLTEERQALAAQVVEALDAIAADQLVGAIGLINKRRQQAHFRVQGQLVNRGQEPVPLPVGQLLGPGGLVVAVVVREAEWHELQVEAVLGVQAVLLDQDDVVVRGEGIKAYHVGRQIVLRGRLRGGIGFGAGVGRVGGPRRL